MVENVAEFVARAPFSEWSCGLGGEGSNARFPLQMSTVGVQ